MQSFEARLSSYQPISKPKSRSKPGFPLSPSTHPYLTPKLLSEAGFYHIASSSSSTINDTVKCFLCGLSLGGWEEKDDPFEEHEKRGGCAWAEAVCSVIVDAKKNGKKGGKYRLEYPTPESLPPSEESTAVRQQTFKNWWPHEDTPLWKPSVHNLAKAGFVYTPTSADADNVTCPLCQYSVEGWEEDDEPLEIHRKKNPDCAFFLARVVPSGEDGAGPSKAASMSKPKSSTRPKRGTAINHEPRVPDSDIIIVVESDPAPARAPSSKSKSSSTTSTSRRKNKVKDEVAIENQVEDAAGIQVIVEIEEDEDPVVDDEARAEKATAKKAKSKAKPKAKPKKGGRKKKDVESEEELDEAENEAQLERGNVAAQEDEPEAGMEHSETPTVPLTANTGKNPRSTKQTLSEERRTSQLEPLISQSQSITLSQPSRPSFKSKSKSKTQAPIDSSANDIESAKISVSVSVPSPTSPQPPAQPQPLSQLHRFSNIPTSPQSVPNPSTKPNQKLKSTSSKSAPTRMNHPTKISNSSHPNLDSPSRILPRDKLNKSINQGAEQARHVINEIIESSSILSSSTRSADPGRTTPSGIGGEGKDEMIDENGEGKDQVLLTDEVMGMTLEQLIRDEMKRRYDELKVQGEEMIADWERRTGEARKRIEGV